MQSLKLIIACALLTPAAHASVTGQTVGLEQLYPSMSDVALDFGSTTVSPGVEFSSSVADYDWDIDDNGRITFSRAWTCDMSPCTLSYTPSSFNGFKLSFPDIPKAITGIDLLSTVGFTSFSADRLTFTGSNVFVSLGGIDENFQSGTTFGASFRIRAVPEPGTLALLGLGLAGVALSRKRSAA